MKETQWIRIVEEPEFDEPLFVSAEMLLILWNRKDLLQIYLCLSLLNRIKISFVLSQPKIAKILGINLGVYLKKRKELEDLGLIKTTLENNNFTRLELKSKKLWGLLKSNRPSIKKYKTPLSFNSFEELLDFAVNTGDLLIKETKEFPQEEGQMGILHNIYNNISSNNISNNNYKISNNKTNNNTNKITYPKEDYASVLDAFKKYKGVGLMGPEVSYHMRAIKLMFQAERTPKQIIDFMKWLHDNEKNEETPWVKTWTIWTVQKKIAEFIGGKLEVNKEEYERI